MAARPKSGITADTDVNLDFLTKEEKEALLSKKMDMIRQRNRALTERHKLIEADKRKAEEAGQAVKPSIDSQTLPAEGAPKSRGRGRGQQHQKDSNKAARERPKSSGDFRDSFYYEPIVDTADLTNYRNKGHGGGGYDRDVPFNTPKIKRKPQPKEEDDSYSGSFEYEPIIDTKDLDKRFGPLLNSSEVRSQARTDYGPPPDPSFNPLADRRRHDKKEDSVDHKRHPRNYGGNVDLSKVKQSMKNMREKERERPQGNKPLDIAMTGKERKNHEEWKAERERYDKERLQRQISDGGNWRRAWDADKISQDNGDQSAAYSSRIEPAKRPAGRIGSGRFDRGERDERPRSAVIGKGSAQHSDLVQPQRHNHHDQQQQQAQPQPQVHTQHSVPGESKTPHSRGRGRGRGRGRSNGPGEKFPRPRTWSGGDDRFVECQKELLLVKFDNTAGDNSVEVEYDDDEPLSSSPSPPKSLATVPGKGPTGRTLNQSSSKQQPRNGKQKNRAPRHKDKPHVNAQQTPTEEKWDPPTLLSPQICLSQSPASNGSDIGRVCTSSHSQSFGDGEEWEDCTESSGLHEEEDFNHSKSNSITQDMHLECRLNPDAPEFLPSSPEFIKTPPGHVKVLNWKANGHPFPSLSQESLTSPQALSTSPQTLSTSPQALSTSPQTLSTSPQALSTSPHLQPTTIRYPTSSPQSPARSSHSILKAGHSDSKVVKQKDAGNNNSIQAENKHTDVLKTTETSKSSESAISKDMNNSCHTTQASGTHITQASGTHITQASGTHIKQASGTHTTQASGTHTTQASGIHTTQASGIHNKTSTTDAVNNGIAASDIPIKPEEDSGDCSKAVPFLDKTAPSLSPADSFPDPSEISSFVDSSDTRKESKTGLENENSQGKEIVKDLLRNMSNNNHLAGISSEEEIIYKDKSTNSGKVGDHLLNEKPEASVDQAHEALSSREIIIKSCEEENTQQNNHLVPEDHVSTEEGDHVSSSNSLPAGSHSLPSDGEPAMPTADVSALP